ncbi:HPr family phosphocarrier protein [Haloferula sargassicola]|uniref:HPr-like protein Crh n=1 Tax=Haloferula sargassicola TaxID=490096 RepID=A0ABP9UNC2_9BACT
MKRARITIPWKEGLHLRPAALLVRSARAFQSSISLKMGERMADARSIIAIMLLSASFGTTVELEASGSDEDAAIEALTAVFTPETPPSRRS